MGTQALLKSHHGVPCLESSDAFHLTSQKSQSLLWRRLCGPPSLWPTPFHPPPLLLSPCMLGCFRPPFASSGFSPEHGPPPAAECVYHQHRSFLPECVLCEGRRFPPSSCSASRATVMPYTKRRSVLRVWSELDGDALLPARVCPTAVTGAIHAFALVART